MGGIAPPTCDLSIVLPVFNEEESLRPLSDEIRRVFEEGGWGSYEIVFVDDGSTDDSFRICCELYDADPDHVRVIRLRRNFGQTAAMAAGFEMSSGKLIVAMDADLQNDPSDIPRMVEKIREGHDIVSGWRVKRKDPLLSRRIPSRIANGLISRITGVPLHDYGCTLKVYQREVLDHMNLYGEMHRFLPALASWAGARVTEMEVNHRPRRYGKSKYTLSRTLRVLLDLVTVKFLLSYSTKPMQVFGRWGFYSLLVGFIAGLLAVLLKVLPPHKDITGNPWLYMWMFFTLGGLQLIGMGLLGEINVRTYYESQSKPTYTVREIRGPQPKK